MARPLKQGLDYFPLNIDFFEDDKVQLVSAEFGIKAEAIAVRLLALVYKNSYWYKWGADECLLLAKKVGEPSSFVQEVVKGLVRRSFFDEGVFDSFQVLTSRGVQARFFEAIERRKEVDVWQAIMLFDVTEFLNSKNVSINPINASIKPIKERKGNKTERKGEESKESFAAGAADEESESEEIEHRPPKKVTPHWNAIKAAWVDFYKSKFQIEPTFSGGSASALKSIADRLKRTSESNPKTALNEWTKEYAVRNITHFLTLAFEDSWRAQNFRLPLLSSHYDSIIQKKPHEHSNSKNGRAATGSGVDTGSALRKIAAITSGA